MEPHNIFAFERERVLHIFLAVGYFSANEFEDFVDRASLKIIPDSVAVYLMKGHLDSDAIKEISSLVLGRFRCVAEIWEFNANGQFDGESKELREVLKAGKNDILTRRNPVLLPPPGKTWMKPSGAVESYFLQASNLFVRHAEMFFFALLLVREWGKQFNENIKTIYIDTIDLYGLVSLACRIRFGGEHQHPITVSFSSYSCYKDVLKGADVATSLMVISATTTHKLLWKIGKKTKWKDTSRTITILDVAPEKCDRDHLVENPKVLAHVNPPVSQSHYRLLPTIRISGEKFTVEADHPKSVVLNVGAHAVCLKDLKLQELSGMMECVRGYSKRGIVRLPFEIDASALFSDSQFREWLCKNLEWHSPVSTSHIVCMGDFRDELIPLLVGIFGDRSPTLVLPDELTSEELRIEGSVVVICPTFSSGSKLLEVSRDLRKHPEHKSIVYLVGVGTPESRSSFLRLKQNLEYGKYQLFAFTNLCTGNRESLALSWATEHDFLRRFDGIEDFPELGSRKDDLENGRLADGNLFFRSEALELHDKFRYWEDRIAPYPTGSPSRLMLMTISYVLQNARTNSKGLPEKDQLTPLPNRRVLLDPENFFRYNDSLIQVAILRAAFPGELDYSDHAEHSASMFYFIERAVQVGKRAVVYEFLLAIVSNRLQLVRSDIDDLCNVVRDSEMDECQWFKRVNPFREDVEKEEPY